LDHLILFFCHSYSSANVSVLRKIVIIKIDFLLIFSKGYERISEISTSKIKNRIATKKNWNENVIVLGVIWLNPHSNWVFFSWFFCNDFEVRITPLVRIISMASDTSVIIWYLIKLSPSSVYYWIKEESHYVNEMPVSGCTFETN